jgi:hypothetical protein
MHIGNATPIQANYVPVASQVLVRVYSPSISS